MYRTRDGVLVGAAMWMPPTATAAKALAKRLLGDAARHREVLVLSRLVVVPGEPQNAAGILLAASTRAVLRDPRWSLLVTYADQAQGHSGTIYKATNWTIDGETKPQTKWTIDGRQVSRLSTHSRTVADMRALGAVPSVSRKFRFFKLKAPT